MGLTPRQQRFVDEYLIDSIGKQAAIRAGYSPKTAEAQASRLLSIAKVREAVDAAKIRQQDRLEIKADVILGELLRIARADLGAAFDDEGNLLPIKEIPEGTRRAISGIDVEELFEGYGRERERVGTTKKIRFWDKVSALEKLGKHLKLFVDRVEHSASDDLAALIAAARERVKGK